MRGWTCRGLGRLYRGFRAQGHHNFQQPKPVVFSRLDVLRFGPLLYALELLGSFGVEVDA